MTSPLERVRAVTRDYTDSEMVYARAADLALLLALADAMTERMRVALNGTDAEQEAGDDALAAAYAALTTAALAKLTDERGPDEA